MIRFFIGILLVLAAVGADDDISGLAIAVLAAIGLFFMLSGVLKLEKSDD